MPKNIINPLKTNFTNSDHIHGVGENRAVPEIKMPTVDNILDKYVHASKDKKRVIAADLINMLDKQMKKLSEKRQLAERLLNEGLSGDEFANLISYLQEDILYELFAKASASDYRSRVMAKVIATRK